MSTLKANKIALLKMLIEHYSIDLEETEIDFDSISLKKTIEEIQNDLIELSGTEETEPVHVPSNSTPWKSTHFEQYNDHLNDGLSQKCAIEEYYKHNPSERWRYRSIGLYCSCPKCS